jgi:hypothetical protein
VHLLEVEGVIGVSVGVETRVNIPQKGQLERKRWIKD